MKTGENYPIDFIVSWVDGNDEEWLAKKNKYLEKNTAFVDVRKRRFRDWNNFEYWFRGVEKYAPWVNHIYLLTPGHYPKWLNLDNEKITLINQDTLFEEKYLPTFNNCAVELLMYKIPGLSEHFVYFNDDMFIVAPTKPEDYFKNGLPRDRAAFAANPVKVDKNGKGICNIVHTNTALVARYFDKDEVFKKNKKKFLSLKNGRDLIKTITAIPYVDFVGFNEPHTANSYLKSTFVDLWEKANVEMTKGISARFREEYAYSQWGVRYWQICMGNFEVREKDFSKMFDVVHTENAKSVAQFIKKPNKKVICINDDAEEDEFDAIADTVRNAFKEALPDKSKFEL